MDELRKLQGQRLKEIRKILGKTQETFTQWLADHGLFGNYDEPYKSKTVAAWESGRRVIPEEIKIALSENVAIDGCLVQYAYLNGDTDFITKSVGAIIKKVFEKGNSLNQASACEHGEWVAVTVDDIAENPLNQFALILFDDLLPIFNHERSEVWDVVRFNKAVFEGVGNLIEQYLQNERQGR